MQDIRTCCFRAAESCRSASRAPVLRRSLCCRHSPGGGCAAARLDRRRSLRWAKRWRQGHSNSVAEWCRPVSATKHTHTHTHAHLLVGPCQRQQASEENKSKTGRLALARVQIHVQTPQPPNLAAAAEKFTAAENPPTEIWPATVQP